jgi:hypothetical protein
MAFWIFLEVLQYITIPYRFPSDNPKKATPTELQWINVFLNSIASFK